MDIAKFKYLSNEYGPYASWAIWDEINTRNTAIIEQSLSELNTKYILLALNISKGLEENWSNFHIGLHDRKLIKAFNRSSLRGAYMTDLLKEVVQPDSKKLKALLKNPDFLKKHIDFFQKEMMDIGASEDSIFILLGKDVLNTFPFFVSNKYKNNKSVHLNHFSDYRKKDEDWIKDSLSKIQTSLTT